MNVSIGTDATETCSCGANDHLVVVGISPFRWEHTARLAWVVECWNFDQHDKKPTYLIDDDGRDRLFGSGWRSSS